MRDLTKILDKILAEIPDGWHVPKADLKEIREISAWSPPEAKSHFWGEAARIIYFYGKGKDIDDMDWQKRIVEIFLSKE